MAASSMICRSATVNGDQLSGSEIVVGAGARGGAGFPGAGPPGVGAPGAGSPCEATGADGSG